MLLEDACYLGGLLDDKEIFHAAQAIYMLSILFSNAKPHLGSVWENGS